MSTSCFRNGALKSSPTRPNFIRLVGRQFDSAHALERAVVIVRIECFLS